MVSGCNFDRVRPVFCILKKLYIYKQTTDSVLRVETKTGYY